jgi:HPt (histidine-containing phosphotransfer) domain-containing protein
MASDAEDVARKKAETQHMLQLVWERSRPMVERRLQVLARAAEAAAAGNLQEPQRDEAESEAHKLAGSLGMFGFTHGTELAREIEQAFEREALSGLKPLVHALMEELLPSSFPES